MQSNKFIADLHIHSRYSIATSKNLMPEKLDLWAKIKGITVVGTGDFTHPKWLNELEEKLIPAGNGLFRLKEEYIDKNYFFHKKPTYFMLSSEISTIYKKNDKVRKIHSIIFAPDFESVKKIQSKLSKIGNINADGRPILGLDAKNLLEIVLEVNSDCFLVPAHIWTPWFSVLGSKSGFNSIYECFEDLTKYIFAVETGLSSDPPMNWRCSMLDEFAILSNSDAHSPENLGREANIFNCEPSYFLIRDSLKNKDKETFLGTIEFYPQEGKYHYDGHRKCMIRLAPAQSEEYSNICPVCKKELTLGVMHRVMELADRKEGEKSKNQNSFYSLIPLTEILSEINGVSKNSKSIKSAYDNLIKKFGSELDLLLNNSVSDIEKSGYPILAEAIKRMRANEIIIQEGYDGEYGVIKLFTDKEVADFGKNIFNISFKQETKKSENKNETDLKKFEKKVLIDKKENRLKEINNSQRFAIEKTTGPMIIIAGPGTGKTMTLTLKIVQQIKNGAKPDEILNITFSRLASNEIKERVITLLNKKEIIEKLTVTTFHAFGLSIIEENLELTKRKSGYVIINEKDKEFILNKISKDNLSAKKISQNISRIKQMSEPIMEMPEIFSDYQSYLELYNLFDFDDLVYIPVKIFSSNKELLSKYQNRFNYINIDEFQDINRSQFELIKELAKNEEPNITVIGDPDQAIYGFRGASNKFFIDFKNNFKNVLEISLDTSYRCSNQIITAAGQMLKKDSYLKGIKDGLNINIKEYDTDKSEAEFVAREIEKLLGGIRFFSLDSNITDGDANELIFKDIAVLCRTSLQIPIVTKALNDHSIPYEIVNEEAFYKKTPFLEIINLVKYCETKNEFYKNILIANSIKDHYPSFYSELYKKVSLLDFIKRVFENHFSDKLTENQEALKKIEEIIRECKTTSNFLKFLESSDSIDTLDKNSERVKIITMHSSKGLEFDTVFLIGCNELFIPFSLYKNYSVDIEEEKRLFYVAMTRAKNRLYLTYPKKISIAGLNNNLKISPFVENIKKELIYFEKNSPKKRKDDGQLTLF